MVSENDTSRPGRGDGSTAAPRQGRLANDKVSHTAEGLAFARALANVGVAGGSVHVADDYARHFLGSHYSTLIKLAHFAPAMGFIRWIQEARFPGFLGFAVARTHYLDARIVEAVDAGIRQVVILGAGFDTRAMRFARGDLHFIEVDHPATSLHKQRLASSASASGYDPPWVSYATCEFGQHALSDCLDSVGFDSAQPAMFLWEGVTMYLSQAVVESILQTFAHCSAPGSAMAFDFFDRGIVDGSSTDYGAQRVRRYVQRRGEPFTFDASPDQMRHLVEAAGLRLAEFVGAQAMHEDYLADHPSVHPFGFGWFAKVTQDGRL